MPGGGGSTHPKRTAETYPSTSPIGHEIRHCLGPIGHLELGVDVLEVRLDGPETDDKTLGDLRARESIGRELEHFPLARGEHMPASISRPSNREHGVDAPVMAARGNRVDVIAQPMTGECESAPFSA